MSTSITDFACLVSEFLTEYLPLQRNYSKNTVLSYRDALKLLVIFIANAKGIRLTDFTMKRFDRALIVEFLEWLRNRGVSVSTANQRLAAIKTFAEYAGYVSISNIWLLCRWYRILNRRRPLAGKSCF